MKTLLCKAAGIDAYSRHLIEKLDSLDEKLHKEKNPIQIKILKELKKTYQNAREVYNSFRDIQKQIV